jgi:hypothetical protein
MTRLQTLIKARKVVKVARSLKRLQRQYMGRGFEATPERAAIVSGLEDRADEYQRQHWTFVEPVFESAFHGRLIEQWPDRCFLDPPRSREKSYDTGFRWLRGQPNEPEHIARFPAFGELLAYLRSPGFGRRVTAMAGDGVERSCYSFLLTSTYPGSQVTSHRDGIALTPDGAHFLNVVFFIDGTGGDHSGGLCILGDAGFSNVVFESRNLRNSALMYHSAAPFYHGFGPVAAGKFRWAIASQFCHPSFNSGATS